MYCRQFRTRSKSIGKRSSYSRVAGILETDTECKVECAVTVVLTLCHLVHSSSNLKPVLYLNHVDVLVENVPPFLLSFSFSFFSFFNYPENNTNQRFSNVTFETPTCLPNFILKSSRRDEVIRVTYIPLNVRKREARRFLRNPVSKAFLDRDEVLIQTTASE